MNPVFLAAGEVSGDLHGARLAHALKELDPAVRMVGWGSRAMRSAGVELHADLTPHSAVGLLEQLPGLGPTMRALKEAKLFLKEQRPSAVVLIDYQGANMKLAREAKRLGLPTIYYIAPQEWIWGFKGGTRKVAKAVDLVLAIFEREAQAYREAGASVGFVGHPLLDQAPIGSERSRIGSEFGLDLKEPLFGILPGSRLNEINTLLPSMLKALERIREEFPTLQAVLPIASPFLRGPIEELVRAAGVEVHLTDNAGMGLIQACDVALAASGTATLEAAIVGTPVVATYKVSGLTAFVARRLMRSPYVTLPNILTGRPIVPELLQQDANPERMAKEVLSLLGNPRRRQEMLREFSLLRTQLGHPGAAQRAAKIILEARKP